MNPVQTFIRNQFSDAQVVHLLDDCRAGRFEFRSCCCLVGRPTNHGTPHAFFPGFEKDAHFLAGRELPGAEEAECYIGDNFRTDAEMMKFLEPICEAEIAYRGLPEPGAMGHAMKEFFAEAVR